MPFLAPPYRQLTQFARHMAVCLNAALPMEQSLQTGGRFLTSQKLKDGIETAIEVVREGRELSEAFEASGDTWPTFFVPMIRVGEQTGRLEEVLKYIERQCRLLDGPSQAVQRLWMIPLALMLTGAVLQIVISLFADSLLATLWLTLSVAVNYALLAGTAYLLFASPFKAVVDHIRMGMPLVGALDRDMAVNRFFSALSMLHAAAGQRVETMIRLAAETIPNTAARLDLLRAIGEIEHGKSISDAFLIPTRLTADETATIAAGELAGTLERSFDDIARRAGEQLQASLELYQQVSFRLLFAGVVFSLLSGGSRLFF